MTDITLSDAQAAADALRHFSAATVHEACGRRGAMDPRIKPVALGSTLCAPAMTARTFAASNLLLHQAIYRTPVDWVLVAAVSGEDGFGYWGDVMTTAALERGLRGLVTDGGVRDVVELRASALPIFAAQVSMRGTVKVAEGEIGSPISIGGVIVNPGDVVVADDDGVVCVALADAAAVAAAAAKREEKEAQIKRELAHGVTTLSLYGFDEGPEPLARIVDGEADPNSRFDLAD
jgi:4-hydroxy-4-methyl-2-oxoglutarate aldolase